MKALLNRLKLRLGLAYRCRCGAFVKPRYREAHERFHDAILSKWSGRDLSLSRQPKGSHRRRSTREETEEFYARSATVLACGQRACYLRLSSYA
jgi:hypothetical protein